MNSTKYFSSTRITVTAVFAALSAVLYLVRIPLSFAFPTWLELNFSDIPALIGAFALGPVSGVIIVAVKILLKLVLQGTRTAFVGELADLLIGIAFVIPAGVIYKRHRSVKGALVAMAVGGICSVAMSVFANRFILIPFYADKMGMSVLAGMMNGLFPNCTEDNFYDYYLWVSVLPFNALRCFISCLVTFPVYKKISSVIKKMSEKFDAVKKEGDEIKISRRAAVMIAVAVFIVVALAVAAAIRYFVIKL